MDRVEKCHSCGRDISEQIFLKIWGKILESVMGASEANMTFVKNQSFWGSNFTQKNA